MAEVLLDYEERDVTVVDVADREDCDAQEALVDFGDGSQPTSVRVPPHRRLPEGDGGGRRVTVRRRKLRGRHAHSRWEVSETVSGGDDPVPGSSLPCLYVGTASDAIEASEGTSEDVVWTSSVQVYGQSSWFADPGEGKFTVPDGTDPGQAAVYEVSGRVVVQIDDDLGAGQDVQLGLAFANTSIFRMDPIPAVDWVGTANPEARAFTYAFSLPILGGFTDQKFVVSRTDTILGSSSDATVTYVVSDVLIKRVSDSVPDTTL